VDADGLRASGGTEYSLEGVSDEEVAELSAALFAAGVRHGLDDDAVVVHPDDEHVADEVLDRLYPETSGTPADEGSSAADRLLLAELRATGGPTYDLDDYTDDERARLRTALGSGEIRHAFDRDSQLVVHRNDEERVDALLDDLFGPERPDDALWRRLVGYAELGDHRTGTDVDLATAEWLADELADMGAGVEMQDVVFDRFDVHAELTIDGEEIASVPVYYEALGRAVTSDVEVLTAAATLVGSAHGLDDVLAAASGSAARVLALDGPAGWPVAPNRPVGEPRRVPVVVVAGDEAGRVRSGDIRLRYDAQLVPGVAPVVVGELGPPSAPQVTVSTPLSGWFACAGERGTGVAVALDLAATLAADGWNVTVVATSGHELDHLGLRVWLDEVAPEPGPVVHIGASMAACEPGPDGRLRLAPRRYVLLDRDPGAQVATSARAGGWSHASVDVWPGEGGTWREAGHTVISFVGQFQWFHTANDVPAVATTPEALRTARDAALSSVGAFLRLQS
jgi:hypothetical protein